jgi:hypothetical protein
MQIFIIFNTRSEQDRTLFKRLIARCQDLHINLKFTDPKLRQGKEKFTVLDIPKTTLEKTPCRQMCLSTISILPFGYGYRAQHPKKQLLTIKRFMGHFDQLVIEQNTMLLNELYSLERDIGELLLH